MTVVKSKLSRLWSWQLKYKYTLQVRTCGKSKSWRMCASISMTSDQEWWYETGCILTVVLDYFAGKADDRHPKSISLCLFNSSLTTSVKYLIYNQCGSRWQIILALNLRRSLLHCKDAAPKKQNKNKKTSVDGEDFLCQLTHNSGPLHRVIRAGAARRSINASLMPRRTNCKPTIQHDERGRGGVGGVR